MALVVFGPNKLPEMMRSAGKALRAFQRESGKAMEELRGAVDPLNIKGDINEALNATEPAPPIEAAPIPAAPEPAPKARKTKSRTPAKTAAKNGKSAPRKAAKPVSKNGAGRAPKKLGEYPATEDT